MSTIQLAVESETIVRLLALGFLGFSLAMAFTPIYTRFAYKKQLWKRPREEAVTGEAASQYMKLHAEKHRRHIPTMAGVIAILSIGLTTALFNLVREQTWLPLAAMIGAGLIGLLDDAINIRGSSRVAGMRAKLKLGLHSLVALMGGWWFYAKLDIDSVHLPFVGDVKMGILMILLFVAVVVATANAVNITDGLDGLAGGLLATSFVVYAIIAFLQERLAVAGFCMTVSGAILSYIWFNIYPARFFMGDVGSFAFGTALGTVAFITNTVWLLPIIGLVFVVEAGSSALQIASKKLRNGKKIFRIAPIHHHFEAMGWPEAKVTMRFWVIGQLMAVVGLLLYLLGGKV